MNKQDNLYVLIKSMDKHEKRFFKLYAKLYNQNKVPHYVHLFEIFDSLKDFNHTILNDKIQQSFSNKNVSQLKQYLREAIYTSLKLYHKKNNPVIQDYESLSTVKILIKKNLLEQAEKLLMTVKKQAKKDENFGLVIRINNELITIKQKQGQRTLDILKQTTILVKEIEFYASQHQQCAALAKIKLKVAQLIFSKDKLGNTFNQKVKKILNQELLVIDPKTLQGTMPKYLYYSVLSFIYITLFKKAQYLETLEIIKSLFKLPALQHRYMVRCGTITNILQAYIYNKRHEAFHTTLEEFDQLLEKHPHLKPPYLYWRYVRELEFYYFNPKEKIPEKNLHKIKEVCTNANKHLTNQTNQNSLLFSLARHHFVRKEYSLAQDFLLKITLQQKIDINEFHFIEIHLINIICYYEIEANEIAQKKAMALQRQLKKQEDIPPQLLTFIKILIKIIKLDKHSFKISFHLQRLVELMQNSSQILSSLLKEDLYFLQIWIDHKSETVVK